MRVKAGRLLVTLALKNFVGLFQVIRDLFCFVLFFFRGVRVSASFAVTREKSMHGQSDVPSCTRLCSALSTVLSAGSSGSELMKGGNEGGRGPIAMLSSRMNLSRNGTSDQWHFNSR